MTQDRFSWIVLAVETTFFSVPLVYEVCTPVQDEVLRQLLHLLPAEPEPGPGLRGVCVPVEPPVAWRFCLGRIIASVQLAPRPDGDRPGGRVRQR